MLVAGNFSHPETLFQGLDNHFLLDGGNILDQAEFPLIVSPSLKLMDARLFEPGVMGLTLHD